MQFRPLGEHIGAEVSGIDLRQPVAPADVHEIRAALVKFGVLVLRDQDIDDAMHVAFSRNFGPLDVSTKKEQRRSEIPEVNEVDRVGDPTAYLSVAQLWHTDGSYKPVPSYLTMLRPVVVCTAGGDTCFANTAAGYAALPDERKAAIDDVKVVHDLKHTRSLVPGLPPFTPEEQAGLPEVVHPLARPHSTTGKKVIYLGCHAKAVVGMKLEDGRALLREMQDWTTQPRFVYQHKWRSGDFVMWDNRGTMHRVTPYDADKYPRKMHRSEVKGAGAIAA